MVRTDWPNKDEQASVIREAATQLGALLGEIYVSRFAGYTPPKTGRLNRGQLDQLTRLVMPLLPIIADEWREQFEHSEIEKLARSLFQELSIQHDQEFPEKL